jgi:L-ascorbate metabolism protein UlaG (beta-lactamase superfamily)
MLPIDTNGTMSIETAAKAVQVLQPDDVFPSNWGDSTEGASAVDARLFRERVAGNNDKTRVRLPEKEM